MATGEFAGLGLASSLLEAIEVLGFERMTPVQAEALPGVLAGSDLVVQAEPGSGKTLAFGLGMLSAALPHLPPMPARVRGLALCPTRELAEQVAEELRKLARRTPNVKVLALCGGVPFAPQRASLRQGAHLVVGTPGRLEEHLRKGSLQLGELSVLVLDEADRMLSMGFAQHIDAILRHVPAERQTLLFSATIRDEVVELSRGYQRDALRITVARSTQVPDPRQLQSGVGPRGGPSSPSVDTTSFASPLHASGARVDPGPSSALSPLPVQHHFYRVAAADRPRALAHWLRQARPNAALVFCNTRAECAALALGLREGGWVAAAIHGEMSQRERTHVMRLFANGSCSVLTATDIAARGWDIDGLPAIVNVGLSRDPSVHLHRVGRTGRAGQPGLAVHFVADEDLGPLTAIEREQGFAASFEPLLLGSSEALELDAPPPEPPMVTFLLSAGKNKKLRPGDILGAVTAGGEVRGEDVGAIHIDESSAYLAVRRAAAPAALQRLTSAPVKGRQLQVRRAALSLRDPG